MPLFGQSTINMYQLTSNIEIGKYRFKGVVECEVISSWENLTDTAKITIPKRVEWDGENVFTGASPIIKKDTPLSISFGLDGKNSQWFKGYITQLHSGIPIVLDCQDEMWQLKKGEFTKSYEKVTLKQLLKDMLPKTMEYEIVADYDLGQWRITKATPAQVLEKLSKDYFIRFWFRDGVLYAGLAIIPKLQKFHKIKYVISNQLEYIRKDDVKLLLKGVIMMPDNKKVEVEIGDKDGEIRTYHKYNISESEMKRFLTQELETLKYDGFRGSFETFILPDIRHGDIVILPKIYDLEDDGRYLVKKVTKSFRGLAARQVVELERRI
jgi:hypothetical protein